MHENKLLALVVVALIATLFLGGCVKGMEITENDRLHDKDNYLYNVAVVENGTLTDEDGHVYEISNNIEDGVYWVGYDHNGTATRLDDEPKSFEYLREIGD